MAYVNEIYASRIADPTKLGEKIMINIPQLTKHDTLTVNGQSVKIRPDNNNGDN